MKKLFLLLLFIGNAFFIRAQNKIAVVAGVHSSEVIEKNTLTTWIYDGNLPDWDAVKKKYTNRIGFHAGILTQLPFPKNANFFFMSGVIFHNKGRKFNFTSDTLALKKRDGLPDTLINTKYNFGQKQYINYIDVPINLLYKFSLGKKAKVVISGGPFFSLFFNGSDNRTHEVEQISNRVDENEDLPVGEGKGQYMTLHYGINGYTGIEFNRIFLTVNYSRGIRSFFKSKFYEGGFHHQVIGCTIGVFLGN